MHTHVHTKCTRIPRSCGQALICTLVLPSRTRTETNATPTSSFTTVSCPGKVSPCTHTYCARSLDLLHPYPHLSITIPFVLLSFSSGLHAFIVIGNNVQETDGRGRQERVDKRGGFPTRGVRWLHGRDRMCGEAAGYREVQIERGRRSGGRGDSGGQSLT